ncbi:MAG TPA: PIN domain-containing protein [Flavobacteriaceae bacterium]|nr:PIN domain-containing protein [Flavobacteriaceae bacterium]
MTSKLFIDSDVVIDFFTDRKPFANSASELFELNEKGKVQLYLSAVSINNIYYIVRKYLGHKQAIKIIEELTEMTKIAGTTRKEIIQGLKSGFKDFEDSIQYSTALAIGGIEAIITRNTKDYINSQIAVLTPTDFLKAQNKKIN